MIWVTGHANPQCLLSGRTKSRSMKAKQSLNVTTAAFSRPLKVAFAVGSFYVRAVGYRYLLKTTLTL